MATYAEYLKSLGASDDDIKLLDTTVARKAYDKMQADAKAAQEAAVAAAAKEWDTKTNEWYTTQVVPAQDKLQKERDTAVADAAAERARIKALQEQGLIEVAAAQDGKPEVKPTEASPVDLSKYVTSDTLMQVAEREGDAIAIAQDIAYEHAVLFPGQRLNFRELRKEALARKTSLEQLWMDKYKVSEARDAKQKAEREAEIAKWKAEGKAEADKTWAEKYGNPDIRPVVASSNPFTNRPPSAGQQADQNGGRRQPWDVPGDSSASRVAKVIKNHPEVLTQ